MKWKAATVGTLLARATQCEMNPVVLKELRQAVRSRAVTAFLLLFLLALFTACLYLLLNQGSFMPASFPLGAQVFTAFFAILAVASLSFIPLYVGWRMAAERVVSNADLMYASALTPGQIIRGKFLSGAYMALLFSSACIPFMTFANLLRGIDFPTIFGELLLLFLVVCFALQLAIFFAALPLSKLFTSVLLAGMGFLSFYAVLGLVFISAAAPRSGLLPPFFPGGASTAELFTLRLLLCAAGAWLLYILSVALITPPAANRAVTLKVSLTAIWALAAGLCLAVAFDVRHLRSRLTAAPLVWNTVTLYIVAIALTVIVSNRDPLSVRVRQSIPRGLWRRLAAFLFFNGAAGGLVWAALLAGATIALTSFFTKSPTPAPGVALGNRGPFMVLSVSQGAYIFAYALTALFLHRTFLRRRPPVIAGIFAFGIPALMSVGPILILFFMHRLSDLGDHWLVLGSLTNLLSLSFPNDPFNDSLTYYLGAMPREYRLHLLFSIGWLAVVAMLNAPWFFRQWKAFRSPLEPV